MCVGGVGVGVCGGCGCVWVGGCLHAREGCDFQIVIE